MTKQVVAGKRVGGFVYLHKDACGLLSEIDWGFLNKALTLTPEPEWNVAKVSSKQVSLLLYEDFDKAAFPALFGSTTIDLASGAVKKTDYSARDNPPILHRKELLLRPDDHRLPAFKAVTRLAEEKGLFADTKTIGTQKVWRSLLAGVGLEVDGATLVPAGSRRIEVSREKTAIVRSSLSAPVSAMIETGMLTTDDDLFDYGCGYGQDVDALVSQGYSAWGWDPNHRPDGPRASADLVNLGFVLNVIEDPHERAETLKAAWGFARKGMTVAVMLAGKTDISGHVPHADGHLTSRSTFQRYFSQSEILTFVSDTVGERATSLGQGIVAVFRDKDLEQRVDFRRRSRAAYLARRMQVPRPDRRPQPPRPELVERIAEEIDAIWAQALDMGRIPARDEISRGLLETLSRKHVSVARALQACAAGRDLGSLSEVADARKEDLLVDAALALFPGSPKYSSLPLQHQRDVRHFYGGSQHLTALATTELSALRNSSHVMEAFDKAASDGVATLQGEVLRFAGVNVARLPAAIRIMLGCADIVHSGFSQSDVFEIGPKPTHLRGIICGDMETALPHVVSFVDVDLGRARAKTRQTQGQVLYLKSRFMAADDERRVGQETIDARLLSSGVVKPDGRGPDATALNMMLLSRTKGSSANG